MSFGAIDALRSDLPFLFSDRTPSGEFEEEWVILPSELAGEVLGELPEEWSPDTQSSEGTLVPLPAVVPDLGAGFPGAPDSVGPLGLPGTGSPPSPDALAFYLPFHYFHPKWWGVYVTLEGVLWLAQDLAARRPCQVPNQALKKVAAGFLYGHEYFHHKSEVWATRTEIIYRKPLYVGPYEAEFRRHAGTDLWTEEAVAEAFGWMFAQRLLKGLGLAQREVACVLDALSEHIEESPPGYRMGAGMLGRDRQVDGERRLAEEYLRAAFPPLPALSEGGWRSFPHAFTGLSRVGSDVNYLVRRGSSLYRRLSLQGRFISRLGLIKKLNQLGCTFVRQGGRHEIWQGPGGKFQIPRHAGDVAQGTLRNILRQSGLGVGLRDFLVI